ncbi:MAG: cupin fold metalloprotein, WbuC family [Gammaproteobacteria bacterium]|nr:cupin fold metalloprotein, WbuC family [Gammaproteobacteria bacterium]
MKNSQTLSPQFNNIQLQPNTKNIVYSYKPDATHRLLNQKLIEELRSIGREENKITRLCFHLSKQALLQSMLIYLPKGASYPLHLHPNKNESYQIIQGTIQFTIKQSVSDDINTFILDKASPFYYSQKNTWHSLQAIESEALYIESREGPFDDILQNDTIWKD